MENKLQNLKEKMDETIFQDVYFSEQLERKVLHSIKQNKSTRKESNFINMFNSFLSIAVIAMIFLGIGYYTESKIHLIRDGNKVQSDKSKEITKDLKQNKNTSIYVPPVQKENYKNMTKEEILTKMINTIDNFETAKGEFKLHYDGSSGDLLVDYELSLHHYTGGYSSSIATDSTYPKMSHYYKGGTMWDINEDNGTYREVKYLEPQQPSKKELTIEEAFSKAPDGNNQTIIRERPPVGVGVNETLFNYEMVSNFTRDLNKWEIEKQNEKLLGHNTLVIKGYKNHLNVRSFRFWVDKDTGIIVKYETYNSAGKVVEYLYPTKLEINVPVDSKHFTPNLQNYKKEDNTFREKGPRILTGNIDNEIPAELKSQWEAAKKKPNETTVLHQDDKLYIFTKKGYLVDRIETNGKEGILYLAKTSPQKSQFTFHALAEGYEVDKLKIVYE
ncbi:hypothetical protein H5P36_24060 [Bacillus sp. APMAM]|nr:hypothetical protein [Bacillus sp. APMAM]